NAAENCLLADSSISPINRDINLSRIYINRGITFKNLRSLGNAAESYEKAMKILERVGDGAEREKFSVELNLAILRTRFRDRKRALTGFENAEKLASNFDEPERKELYIKVLTNKAQLFLEFHEVEIARDIIGKITAIDGKSGLHSSKEKKARINAQLGQLIAHMAENQESRQHANEHLIHALKFFSEAASTYEEIELSRDAITQRINHAEALIKLKRIDQADNELKNIHKSTLLMNDANLTASTVAKLLVVAILKLDEQEKDRWIEAVQMALKKLSPEARPDFLEDLESQLRWMGSEHLIKRIQEFRRQEGHN
ncbi:hypothetical protein KKB99_08305, partial [bacterium]|nr:hypothetical protein [bacterium]MBU1025993.1 hypothetical protein [bacterium]